MGITPQNEMLNGGSPSKVAASGYKSRHEYLRDVNYFNTWQRSQQFNKQWKEKKENIMKNDVDRQSIESLDDEKKSTENELKIDSGHRKMQSFDTQAAMEGGAEPYQPMMDDEEDTDVKPLTLQKQQSAMV